MHGLAVYVNEGLSFARDLSLEKSADSYLCFLLVLLHSVSYFFFLYRSPSLSLCMVFDSISSNIDEILSINLLSLETLTVIIRTGSTALVELIDFVNYYNFSISNDFLSLSLTQMVNIPTRIAGCDCHSPALLDIFLSSDATICSAMASPPLGNSDHVVVSVSIGFPSNSQQDTLFHCIAYDYSRANWDGV